MSNPNPSVSVVYVFPVLEEGYKKFAERFVLSLRRFAAEYPFKLVCVCNGGPRKLAEEVFAGMDVEFFEHDNVGCDIGAYQFVAPKLGCDLVVFLGSKTTFKKSGWLRRLVDAFKLYGYGLYGTLASMQYGSPHLVTTGFACSPKLIESYGRKVETYHDRAEFEHGPFSLTAFAEAFELSVKLVTPHSVSGIDMWSKLNNGLNDGDQSNCLIGYSQTDIYDKATPEQRAIMRKRVLGLCE